MDEIDNAVDVIKKFVYVGLKILTFIGVLNGATAICMGMYYDVWPFAFLGLFWTVACWYLYHNV